MPRRKIEPAWRPMFGQLAFYNGRTSTLAKQRQGFLVKVVAETSGDRLCVEAIGHSGKPVLITIKAANLSQPQPDLFDGLDG